MPLTSAPPPPPPPSWPISISDASRFSCVRLLEKGFIVSLHKQPRRRSVKVAASSRRHGDALIKRNVNIAGAKLQAHIFIAP